MSTALIIPPSRDLVEEVFAHLKADGSDYSCNLVVFPGKRPSHFLRKLIGQNVGHGFIPPRIYSIDNFVDFIYSDQLGLPHREIEAVDAVAILHDIYLSSPERFSGTSFDALDAFLPLGLKLFGELEELKMANLQGRKLEEALGGVTLGSLRPLSNVYDAFYRKVNTLKCCTRGLKYSVVADFLLPNHLNDFAPIILAGFFALTNAEATIFRTVASVGTALFLFQEGKGIERHIEALGLNPKRAAGEPVSARTTQKIHFYQSPDSHGQVFGLTGSIRKQRGSEASLNERTVIVLPAAETLLPVYHETLALLDQNEYNISLGYPVTRTPVYGFLQNLMDLAVSTYQGRFYAPDYMKFILHPYTKNILFDKRSDVTRVLFHSIEEHFAGEKSRTFFSLDELEGEASLFTGIAQRVGAIGVACSPAVLRQHLATIHDMTVRRLDGTGTLGHIAQQCINVLMYIDEHSTARQHPLFRPYVETLIEALDSVAGSLLANASLSDPLRAMGFIRRCAGQAQVPFPGTPLRGVQVLGLLETRNLRFDTVHLLDANEDTLTGGSGHYTIIPQKIRERLGLPTRRDREELVAYYLDTLIQGAKEVHISFSENAQKEKSRIVEQLLWERQKQEDKDEVHDFIHVIGYNVWLANATPEPVQKSPEVLDHLRQFTFHATALDTYLRCQLQFYYRYVLGLREKEEVAGDIDSGDIGSFVHDVLKVFFKETVGRLLVAEDLDVARLNAILDLKFPQWFGEERTGAKHLLLQQLRTQLERFLTRYQLPLCVREPITVLELETKIPRAMKDSSAFSGKLDRVERRGQKIWILDYKTGGDEKWLGVNFKKLIVDQRETWGEAIASLQLPMYALLYSQQTGSRLEDIVPAYLLLGKNRVDERIEISLFDEDVDPQEVYRQLETIIVRLVDEIIDDGIPFRPTDALQEHCVRCPFTTICGTAWVRKAAR